MEGLYYPDSENKGADQLRSYCATDLRLCFRLCKKPVFSQRGSMDFALKHETARFPSIVSSSDLPVVQYTKTESNIA